MKILIVYAHPSSSSFCNAILQAVQSGLSEAGHEFKVADLYAENFQPAMIEADFAQFQGKPLPDEILKEQERVEWSDGIVFIFPIWWWSFPAILKGWVDRVLSYGWAYEDPKDPDSGYLKPRKILVLPTAGGDQVMFAKRKYDEAFETQLVVGTWDYCNFKDVTTHIFHSVNPGNSKEVLAGYLQQAKELSVETFKS